MAEKPEEKLPRIVVSSPAFREDLRENVIILTHRAGAGEELPAGLTEDELEHVIERLEASGEKFKPFALVEGELVDMPENIFEFTSEEPGKILKDTPKAKTMDLELISIPFKRLLGRR